MTVKLGYYNYICAKNHKTSADNNQYTSGEASFLNASNTEKQ